MTPRQKLIQELQREGVRLWRRGICLSNLKPDADGEPPFDDAIEAELQAEEALAFAGTLEALAIRIRKPPGVTP